MGEFGERLLDIGEARLHVREAGVGQPIILLHGITANNAVWDPIASRLAADGHVISVSQRGHGKSHFRAAETNGYAAEDYASDVIAIAEQFDGKAIVVGHSLGGRNALTAASLRPDLFAAVIGIDFTPFIETEVFDQLAARVAGGDQAFENIESVKMYLADRYRNLPADAIERRATHGYLEVQGQIVPRADRDALAKTAEGLRAPLEHAVRDIQVPTVLVRGEESVLVSEAAFGRTRALRPDLFYTVVPGADHYVPEEQPEAIVAIVRILIGRAE